MDVRCERCLTEYELGDDSVSEAGTSVQCTTCGHTFRVRRSLAKAPGSILAGPLAIAPAVVEWRLHTAKGQVHRFLELSVVHRWIVERKVTRQDRISRPGEPWRQLDEIEELQPFFDIVDEADRTRAALARAEEGLPLGLEPQAAPRRAAEPDPPPVSGVVASTPSFQPVPVAPDAPEQQSARGRFGKMVITLVVAAGVAYYGISRLPPVKPAEGAPPLVFPTAVKGTDWAPLPAAPAPPETPVAAAAALPSAMASPSPSPSAGEPESSDARLSVPYSRLVTEAFRLIDGGALTRAKQVLEDALEQQPEGPEALAGMGYVYLDRNRFSTAIDYFKRALAESSNPAALFGLAEAYRYGGERRKALDAYRRFLAAAPGDRDASIARRQIRALSGQARGTQVAPASSILQEGAK